MSTRLKADAAPRTAGAHNEYVRRLERCVERSRRLDRLHIAYGNVRLATVAVAALIAWSSLVRHWHSPLWLIFPAVVFAVLAILHESVLRARRQANRAARFYEHGLARLEDRWAGKGFGGERFDDPLHPYSEDLDIFGKGSLFELLCTARLRTGEETLARWLLSPARLPEIHARQQAIEELRPRLDLREHLALAGEELRSEINPGSLIRWAERPPILDSRVARWSALALSLLAVAAAAVWAAFGIDEPFLGVAVIEAAFYLRLRRKINDVIELIGEPAYGLELFAHVLARLERERFSCPRLADLRARLDTGGLPASRTIARLNRLMDLLHSRDNAAVRVIGPPLMWTTQLAFAIEAWRARTGPSVRRWVVAAGEIEALLSLSGYAYEHPSDPFPEFTSDGPCYESEALAHPLLPQDRVVCNDVKLCRDLRALVISGSNMSGKSTLLRTVGVNAVLAMAGAPVRAARLKLSPIAVGASIRAHDSLQGGTSRFYAEIKRLRHLVDITRGPLPLLFLLDELLHGTNSHDRRIGGEAVVRSLVEHGSIGLLTTHDLALAHIADALAPHSGNMHFEDTLVDGQIHFDYKLRPGVVRKSNALELMRSVGLEV